MITVYGDENGFEEYAEQRGWELPAGGDVNSALLRGSLFVDRYEPKFSGRRAGGFAQARAWPRDGAETYYGESVPSDIIPAVIEQAAYEAAFLELTNPGSLSPVVTGSATVKREKVGSLEIEYASSSSASVEDIVALATPVVTSIEGLLWMFFRPCLPAILVV